jgi:hypothetical protein
LGHGDGSCLWDWTKGATGANNGRKCFCGLISVIDSNTIALVNKIGGISKIAVSHPHYYTSMVEWSRA